MRIAVAYASGSLGGFVTALFIWLLGDIGITSAAGVAIAPALTPAWLYSRAVWGGLWGFAFLLPFLAHRRWWVRALVFSLGPTLSTWLIILPVQAEAGVFGFGLGLLTPVFVAVFNATWALTTGASMAAVVKLHQQELAS